MVVVVNVIVVVKVMVVVMMTVIKKVIVTVMVVVKVEVVGKVMVMMVVGRLWGYDSTLWYLITCYYSSSGSWTSIAFHLL